MDGSSLSVWSAAQTTTMRDGEGENEVWRGSGFQSTSEFILSCCPGRFSSFSFLSLSYQSFLPLSLSKTAYIPFFIYIIQPSAVVESCVAACTIETRGREGRLLLPACQSKPPSILLYKERSGAEFERNWLDGRLLAAAPPAVSCRVVSCLWSNFNWSACQWMAWTPSGLSISPRNKSKY